MEQPPEIYAKEILPSALSKPSEELGPDECNELASTWKGATGRLRRERQRKGERSAFDSEGIHRDCVLVVFDKPNLMGG
jgi:hypothetical protein